MVDPFLTAARQLQNVAIVTNIHGFDRTAYADKLLPTYRQIMRRSGLQVSFQLGSYDSFVDLNEPQTRQTFLLFFD